MAATPSASISATTLDRAVAQGVLTTQQVEMLRYLEGNAAAGSPAEQVDDEQFRFINGFGDIFVTIGIALFLSALSYFASQSLGGAGCGLVVAAASWLLAEYFARRRRMALPSIVLLLAFAASIFIAALLLTSGLDDLSWRMVVSDNWPVVIAGLATIAATALHYRRFHIPITFAAGVAALVASVLGLVFGVVPGLAETFARPILLACGIGVFALAMRFDLSDPKRQTRRTDIAFWLHMLAAPLVVHPLVSGLIGTGGLTIPASGRCPPPLLRLPTLPLPGDRAPVPFPRPFPAGVAFGSLVTQIGFSQGVVPLTMLVLGALVLSLSAGWHGLRRRLLALLPAGLVRRLPSHT